MIYFDKIFRPNKLMHIKSELKEQSPIIIMARGHSGTRLLSYVCHHLGIKMWDDQTRKTGDTNRNFSDTIKKLAKTETYSTANNVFKKNSLIRFQIAAHRYFKRTAHNSSNWGWKFPETYLIAPIVFNTFPKGKFIHMIRDGRDLAFKEHLTDDPKRKVGRKILNRVNQLESPHYLQAAASWKFQVDSFDNFKEHFSKKQLLEIYFEDICTKPDKNVNKISNFLSISSKEQATHYLNKNINLKKVSQYENNSIVKVREVESLIEETLTRHNYKLLK